MTGKIGLPALIILLLAFTAGANGAVAQTAVPDEAVKPDGIVGQQLALTTAQQSAIYNAVIAQRGRTSSLGVPVAVGALVPPSVELRTLPDQAAAGDPSADLKYAMVENTIVMVDPIRMRVVGIIHARDAP